MTGYHYDPDGVPVIHISIGRVKPNNQAKPGPIGNTQGIIVPETSPNTSGTTSAPTPGPPGEPKGWWKSWGSDVTHGILDGIGLIPVAGEVANLVGAGIYLLEGDKVSAAMDIAAMWPAGGQAATAAKYGRKAGGAVLEQAEKKAAQQAAEAAEKRALKEAEERAAREAEEAARKNATGGTPPPKKNNGGNVRRNCWPLQNGVSDGDNYRGGRHDEIRRGGSLYDPPRESHHMPADSAYDKINGKRVSSGYKPSIQMDKADHEKTASWGNSKASTAYQDTQRNLIKRGKAGYVAAMMMDIADVRAKFGNKYDGAITQMLAWATCMGYI